MKFYIKKILTHSSFYGISNLFVTLTGFILIPLYSKYFTPEEFGIYSLIMVFGTVVYYIYDMGMLNALVRYYYEFNKNDFMERNRIVSTVLWFFIILSFVLSIILLWNSNSVASLLVGDKKYFFLIQLMVVIIFLNTLSGVPVTVLRIEERSALYMFLFGLRSILTIVFTYILLAVLKRGLAGVYEGMLLATFIFGILTFLFTIKNYNFSFSAKYFYQMLKYGLPFCPVMFFSWVIDFFNRYLLRHYFTLADVGLYSLGCKFGQIIYMAIMAFLLCWGPILFDIIKENGDTQRTVARLSTYIIAVFMFVCLLVSIFSREFVILMSNSSYYSSYKVVPVVSFAYYLFGIYMLFLSGILVSKNVFSQPVILGVAAFINILLNIILIPAMGIIGAAIAIVLTYFFVAVYTFTIAQRHYYIPYELSRLISITIIGIVIFLLSLFVPTDYFILGSMIKFLIILLYPICLFLLGVFGKDKVRKIKETEFSFISQEYLN